MSFEELKALLLEIGCPEDCIEPDSVREEAGLDSLAVAELVLVLRREKGVLVTEEEIHAVTTLGELAELLAELRAELPGERRAVAS
ncbi:acyl carrier protein [Kitasatospora sp. McL0602]|uniref:acyl carrier protein n=1 Tax=Kitasatospora sp. McL0602 TaxID=3439530 RepID=UPI003F8CE96B